MVIRIGSRGSNLALKQVEEIRQVFPKAKFRVITYQTSGDKDKLTPISKVEGSDFFTKEIDQALLREEIDLAIHSSKDLPQKLANGLIVLLETKSLSPFDALVARGGFALKDLPKASRIGTSSQRRKTQIKRLRPDLKVIDIRGTIEERLSLIGVGKIDALIVAKAALIRLGKENLITEVLDLNNFPTHPKQGSLSLVARSDKWQSIKSILLGQGPASGN